MSNFWIYCLFFIFGCTLTGEASSSKAEWHLICGRDEGKASQRIPIYRVKVSPDWCRQDTPASQSNADTMRSICEFTIGCGAEILRITLHNFPSNSMQERIPPAAQIARWKRQFDRLALTDVIVNPVARGGFKGLYFEGRGVLHSIPTAIIGWVMQMAPEHYQNLDEHSPRDRQRRADYTIKIQGCPEIIDKHRKELMAFADSFELIEEIPWP